MQVNRVWAVYWSATDRTKKIVMAVARAAGEKLGLPVERYDFTLPTARQSAPDFQDDDLVIFGTPTYAGRVPNVLLKYLATVRGNGAAAVPVVTFGNRAFDDSLCELRDILLDNGFHPFAAGAFACEHSFSTTLGAGRPDADDLSEARTLGERAAALLAAVGENTLPIAVDGRSKEERVYYKPRVEGGRVADIRKVKPKTNDLCDCGGLCARICPMGAINPDNVKETTGICIKCGACVKKCPRGAKYFDDPDYLYHKTDLEETYQRRAVNRLYLA